MSSLELAASERVRYVHCNFCNTILAVSVPSSSLYTIVTVRCGYCLNLLSVNMSASLQTLLPLHHHHHPQQSQKLHLISEDDSSSGAKLNKNCKDSSSSGSGSESGSGSGFEYGFGHSSSKSNKVVVSTTSFDSIDLVEPPRRPPIRPPEKRQRVPSAYNRFIKEEIQRIKASNPDITHREAFSTAAKNWAHFPHIHFGLKLDGNKHAKLDHESFAGEGTNKKKCSASGLMMYDMTSV